MPIYSLEEYESACRASNAALEKARKLGFTDAALARLTAAIRHEKKVKAYMDDNPKTKKNAELIRRNWTRPTRALPRIALERGQ